MVAFSTPTKKGDRTRLFFHNSIHLYLPCVMSQSMVYLKVVGSAQMKLFYTTSFVGGRNVKLKGREWEIVLRVDINLCYFGMLPMSYFISKNACLCLNTKL